MLISNQYVCGSMAGHLSAMNHATLAFGSWLSHPSHCRGNQFGIDGQHHQIKNISCQAGLILGTHLVSLKPKHVLREVAREPPCLI